MSLELKINDYFGGIDDSLAITVMQEMLDELECKNTMEDYDELVYDRLNELIHLNKLRYESNNVRKLDIKDDNIDRLYIENRVNEECFNSLSELPEYNFSNKALFTMFDISGVRVRITWYKGELVKCSLYNQGYEDIDLTSIASDVIGSYKSEIKDLGLVEAIAKITITMDGYKEIKNRYENIKTLKSAIYFILSEGNNYSNTRLLDILFENVIFDNQEYETLDEKFNYLENTLKFKTPIYWSIEGVDSENYKAIMEGIFEDSEAICSDKENVYPFEVNALIIQDDNQWTVVKGTFLKWCLVSDVVENVGYKLIGEDKIPCVVTNNGDIISLYSPAYQALLGVKGKGDSLKSVHSKIPIYRNYILLDNYIEERLKEYLYG